MFKKIFKNSIKSSKRPNFYNIWPNSLKNSSFKIYRIQNYLTKKNCSIIFQSLSSKPFISNQINSYKHIFQPTFIWLEIYFHTEIIVKKKNNKNIESFINYFTLVVLCLRLNFLGRFSRKTQINKKERKSYKFNILIFRWKFILKEY